VQRKITSITNTAPRRKPWGPIFRDKLKEVVMAKQGMNRDGEHPPVTKNKEKHKEEAFVPLIQGNAKSGNKKAIEPNPPPKDKK
jgi:hypothetical protein